MEIAVLLARTDIGTLCARNRDDPLPNRNRLSHKRLHDGRHDGHEARRARVCLISGGIQPLWGTLNWTHQKMRLDNPRGTALVSVCLKVAVAEAIDSRVQATFQSLQKHERNNETIRRGSNYRVNDSIQHFNLGTEGETADEKPGDEAAQHC